MEQTRRITVFAALLLALAAVAAACSSTVESNSNPSCPADGLPTEGSACSVEGEACGAIEECGPIAVCRNGVWVVDDPGPDGCGCGDSCLPPCPDTQPTSGSACSDEGRTCSYTDASCSDAGADVTCSGGVWNVSQYGPACAPGCPSTLPIEGGPCSSCCLASPCTYLDEGGCPAHLTCEKGVWTISAETCTPASTCAPLSMGDCLNSNDCRWITQSGCDSSPPSFPQGCYPKADCASDADCTNGGVCQTAEVDPCPGADCGACSGEVHICVP